MKQNSLKFKTINGFLWSFAELILNQGVQFIIQIILARLLLPEDFGVIGMITVFIAISNIFVDSGLSNALIREKEVTDKEYSTVFYFNLAISVLLYVILFILAPIISIFFNNQIIIPILRILSLTLIINSFGLIQRTMMTRKIDFKTQTKISVAASVLSGIIGICAALVGMGIWSLVIRTITMNFIQSVLLSFYNRWIPSLEFDYKAFKKLFKYSWKILSSSLLDTLYNNIYYLIIGKKFSAVELGYYTNADKLKSTISLSVTSAVQKVSYPVLSSIENGSVRLKKGYKKIIKSTAFIIFPVMIGLAATSKWLIVLLLGDKWSSSIIYFQILCFEGMMYPIHAINLNILQVKGRSDLFLKLEVIKKIIGISIIAIVLWLKLKVIGLLIGIVIECYISYFLNAYYSNELVNYPISEQLRDMCPSFFNSIFMGIIVYFIGNVINQGRLVTVVIQVLLGIFIYAFINIITKSDEIKIMEGFVKEMRRGKEEYEQ